MANSPPRTGFGSTANSPFGAPKPAFGATATTSAGGGLFGSGATTTTAGSSFGTGAFGTSNNAAKPFGSTSTLFGSGSNTSAFGQPAASTTTGTTGGLFGGGSNALSNFGTGNTAGAGFGATATVPVGDPPGTNGVAFTAYQEKETNGGMSSFQNICFQDAYKKFSPEELRLVDYAQGRQFGNGIGATSTFGGGGFGQPAQNNTGFGANTNTGGGLFGQQQPAANTAFGTNNNTTTTNAFGGAGGLFNKAPTTGLFGNNTTTAQPAQQTGGLFGTNTNTTTGAFGAGTGTGAFGGTTANNNATGGLFGNKPTNTGFGTGFSQPPAGNTTTPFGGGTTTNAFGTNNTATTGAGGLFGTNNAQPTTGIFASQQPQQQAQPTPFGTAFGQNNNQQQQQPGGGLFGGQQQKPTTGLFGTNTAAQPSTGLFGTQSNNSTTPFGQNNNQQQASTGGLFGTKLAAPTGGLFGQPAQQQTGQTGGLFSNMGANNQTQQPQSSLFGQNQQKPSLFGTTQPATGGLFGAPQQQQQQQQVPAIYPNGTSLPLAHSNSLFGSSQNTPQGLTTSIADLNAFGTPALFAGLGQTDVQNPGPLATPLSSKNKSRKPSILPMYKLTPGSASKGVTPVKRGYGFSYSTYGSPVTPSSTGSTPGAFSQSLLGGNFNRSLSKSFSSSNLRRSINVDDSILSPGSFSASMGPRAYNNRFNKLTIDKNLRVDLFSPVSTNSNDSPTGPRKIPKRVSFDTSNAAAGSPPAIESPKSPQVSPPDLGSRGGNGEHVNGGDPSSQPEMEQAGTELPTVQEESSPASTSSAPVPGTGPGEYWMTPSMDELVKMTRAQLCQVNLTVGRHGVGFVRFKVPVNLVNVEIGLICGYIVVLETRTCTVYPDDVRKPAVGKGLNVPSEISLLHSWPRNMDKKTGQPIKTGRLLDRHIGKLRNTPGTNFKSYDPETGTWVFEVEHFTTYGLFDDDDDETDGDTLADITVDDVTAPSSAKQPRLQGDASPTEPEEDTFEFRRKRRALPGAFDYTGEVSDGEDEMADVNQQSFLSSRSADPASQALVHPHEDEEMDVGHALPEDQDSGAVLGYHQAAEPETDTYHGSMAESQEIPGGILRARLQNIKGANSPLKIQVADGDDWMDMLQKTISPAKRDRAVLKTINEDESYESLKESIRQMQSPEKPRTVPDGRGFATSIELMNSLFEKPKASVRSTKATIPTSGFKVGLSY